PMMVKTAAIISLLLITACSAGTGNTLTNTWPDIRDGVVHIRVPAPPKNAAPVLKLSWQDAWISEAQTDHVYLLKPDGSLQTKLTLTEANTPGTASLPLNQTGDYQLHVAGASFRTISVSAPENIAMVFEPVKVHKSISLPAGGKLYFQAEAGEEPRFSGKYHGGVSAFALTPAHSPKKSARRLRLKDHEHHWQFDSLAVAPADQPTVWELSWEDDGKVSFWLDGTSNLFAMKREDLFTPDLENGQTLIRVSDEIAGPVPAIGAALPFTLPPRSSYPLIEKWQISAANHYTFSDALTDKPGMDLDFLQLYQNRFNITHNNLILAQTGRKPLIEDVEETRDFLIRYLRERHAQGLLENTYLAFADEPNLNYPGFAQFENQFARLAAAIKQHPDKLVNQTLIAAPQSSRFLNGPTRRGSEDRKGIHWAEELVRRHGQWIDAISWHEWMVRDLIDTGRYREAVLAADGLVNRHQSVFRQEPQLIIGQTNISSGKSLSPYEQETDFAALWWTSVVIQSSQPGKLDQLIWFKAADDPKYKKGLAIVSHKGFQEKPVSKAMEFINRNLGHLVLASENPHPEIDLLAMLSEDREYLVFLGVNKSRRRHTLTLTLPETVSDASVTLFEGSHVKLIPGNQKDTLMMEIAGEAIFAIRARRNAKTTDN
ncbi:MAG: hypothetical protein R3208_16005, partial [Ketobacteraceae bacterium]|nr:hypothetical protein [Ketobacteraceae bacterium]